MGMGNSPGEPLSPAGATQPGGARKQPIRLRVQVGPNIGQAYTMSGDTLSIGRAQDNDLVLDDAQASRYHARLFQKGDELFVEDMGSTNGTLVNQRRITGAHALQPTETIAVGGTVFSVEGFSAPTTIGMPPMARPAGQPAGAQPSRGPAQRPLPGQTAGTSGTPWLVIGGIIGLLIVVGLIVGIAWLIISQPGRQGIPSVPEVTIRSPVTGSQVDVGVPVTVNATASDPNGVTSVELSVNGAVVDQEQSAASGGQVTLPVSLSWTPSVEGRFTLEVRAFNSQGRVSAPTTVLVNSVDNRPPTATAGPATATLTTAPSPSDRPVAITTADLNVREGPGQQYAVLALVVAGTEMEITGINPDGNWWQVVYPPDSDGHGWIYAPFTRTENSNDVPVVVTPAPPEVTATATEIPTATITQTPTPTLLPSITPEPTPTPTEENTPVVELRANRTEIVRGECVVLDWRIENVTAAFLRGGEFDNMGVTGPVGSRETCPLETTLYVLWADTADGPREATVTVTVRSSDQTSVIRPTGVGGLVRQDGKVLPQFISGDDSSDLGIRAFLAFDLGDLVAKEILEARLDLSNYVQTGNPFDGLGRLEIEIVNWWPMLDSTDYSASAEYRLGSVNNPAELINTIDLTQLVRDGASQGDTIVPIRIRFENESDQNGQDDYINWEGARLVILYQ